MQTGLITDLVITHLSRRVASCVVFVFFRAVRIPLFGANHKAIVLFAVTVEGGLTLVHADSEREKTTKVKKRE